MFYNICKAICMFAFRIWYKIEYTGSENVPNGGGYILICNHLSNLDPIILAGGVKEPIHYMAKAELFTNPFLAFIFRHVNAYPVERGTGDTSAIDNSVKLIAESKIVGIFPEGTRSKDGNPLRPKSGASLVAKMTCADVLPCGIIYENKGKFRSKVSVKFGSVIPHEKLGFTEEQNARELKTATKIMFGSVLSLIGVSSENEH